MPESKLELYEILIKQIIDKIETILIASKGTPLSEYSLIQTLRSPDHDMLNHLTLNQRDELFQLHFLVFHSLYKLKEKLLLNERGLLEISPLSIQITECCKLDSSTKQLKNSDKLADYYLNIANLTDTTTEMIDQLILSFWKGFHQPNAHQASLEILELTPPVTFSKIKKQYRRLASQHHPDKGGSKEMIQKINHAMATLSQSYKHSGHC